MSSKTEENIKSKPTWTRLLFIILYAICFNVAEIVLATIAIVQFVSSLITGEPLPQLQKFGTALSTYLKQLSDFLTYAKNEKPFPIGSWPEERDVDTKKDEDVIITPTKNESSSSSQSILGNGDEAAT